MMRKPIQYKSQTKSIQNIEELFDLCRETGLNRNEIFAQAQEFLAFNPNDPLLQEFVAEPLAEFAAEQVFDPDPFRGTNPIVSDGVNGIIKLGFVEHTGVKYGINPDDLTTNTLIFGSAGGGKTSLVKLMLAQLLELGIKGLMIPDRKGNLDSFVSYYKNYYYIPYQHFNDNALRPVPGDKLKNWLGDFFMIMANFFDLRSTSRMLLMDKALWLFEQWDFVNTGRCPTILDLYRVIKGTKYPLLSHYARYAESCTSRLKGLLDYFGDCLCSKRIINWEKLLTLNIAIGLEDLPFDFQSFYIAYITSKIRHYIIARDHGEKA